MQIVKWLGALLLCVGTAFGIVVIYKAIKYVSDSVAYQAWSAGLSVSAWGLAAYVLTYMAGTVFVIRAWRKRALNKKTLFMYLGHLLFFALLFIVKIDREETFYIALMFNNNLIRYTAYSILSVAGVLLIVLPKDIKTSGQRIQELEKRVFELENK